MRCQIDAIDECSTEDEIRLSLKNLPKDLNETYERILLKILNEGDETAHIAEKILTWLVGATRPLGLFELEEAMMIEPGNRELNTSLRLIDPSDVLTICGTLVEAFSDEFGLVRVRLSHFTVQASIKHRYL